MIDFIIRVLRSKQFSPIRPYLKRFFNWKSGSTSGSNWRRVLTRTCIIFSILLLIEAALNSQRTPAGGSLFAGGMTLVSLYFFVDVVLLVPFRTSDSFTVNVPRLFVDTIVSATFLVMSFAAIYRVTGISPAGSPLDHVYFSAVTFSTLGFGDYSPVGFGKAAAAFQAMLGNIHLGFLVGSTFVAIQNQSADHNPDQS